MVSRDLRPFRAAVLLSLLSLGIACDSGGRGKGTSTSTKSDAGDEQDSVAGDGGRMDGASSSDTETSSDAGPDAGPDDSCVELTALRNFKADPSGVGLLFTAVRCADKMPVAGLKPEQFAIAEDDKEISTEADPGFVPNRGRRVYITLLLDMSSSTKPALEQLIAGAKDFVNELLEKRKINVFIGIELFDGAANTTVWQLPIRDPARLKSKLDSLSTFKGTDGNSTNLNGATIAAISNLQQRQQLVINANDKGVVTQGYLVVFTDGADTAERRLVGDAARAIAAANAGTRQLAEGALPPVDTYAVALAGSDYKADTFAQLFTGAGAASDAGVSTDAGTGLLCSDTCEGNTRNGRCEDGRPGAYSSRCLLGTDCTDCKGFDAGVPSAPAANGLSAAEARRRVLEAANATELSKRFSDLAQRIAGQLEGTYLLAYCSPKRMGMHKVTLRLKTATAQGSTIISLPFDATGFAGGCSAELFTTACDTKQCGGFNCGACDDETESCNAAADLCENACLGQKRCDGSTINNPLGYPQTCQFGLEHTQCNGQCIDARTDKQNCGKCGNACNSSSVCVDGVCTCPNPSQLSCSGPSPGCFDGQTDRTHCGSCTTVCPNTNPMGAPVSCKSGSCDCGAGYTLCNNACVDVNTDRNNCGGCGVVCSGDATCSAGACVCTSVSLNSCQSAPTSKQQVCVNLQSNAAHCGKCGKTCGPGGSCSAGVCSCGASTTLCDGSCVNTQTDTKNCGRCGMGCGANEVCSAGSCTTSAVAGCTSGTLTGALPIAYSGTLGTAAPLPGCSDKDVAQTALSFAAPKSGSYTFAASATLGGVGGFGAAYVLLETGKCADPSHLNACASSKPTATLTEGQTIRVIIYSDVASDVLFGFPFTLTVTGG